MTPSERERRVIVHCVPTLHVGGVNRSLLANLRELASGDHQHVLCVLSDSLAMAPAFEALGIEVVTLGHSGRAHTLRTIRRIRTLLRERDASIVHTHLLLPRVLAGLAARTAGVPHVATVHSTQREEFLDPDSSTVRRRFVLTSQAAADDRLVTRFVAVSQAAAELLREIRPRSADRIVVIPNGIELGEFDAPAAAVLDELRTSLGIAPTDRVILNVGRMVPAKNQQVLVPVMERLLATNPDARLLVVGQGKIQDEITALVQAADLGDRIELLGLRTDVPSLLHLAEVVVAPSTEEGFGLILIEALATRTPVVASDIAAFTELIESGTEAVLVPPHDATGFAAALADALDHPDTARQRADAGRAMVERRFTSQAVARQLDDLYTSLIAEPDGG